MEDGRKLLDTDGKRLGSGTEQIRTEKDRAQELRYIYSHSATLASTTLRLQAQSERRRSAAIDKDVPRLPPFPSSVRSSEILNLSQLHGKLLIDSTQSTHL